MADRVKRLMGHVFASIFLTVSIALLAMAALEFGLMFVSPDERELISGVVRAINTTVIALATFELGVGIGKEYTVPEAGHGLYPLVRRTVTRFVSLVCIALVLEGLIMVIKYSQLELAGNLYYPVAIIVGSSVLLTGLGIFIHLTRPDVAAEVSHPAGTRARAADRMLYERRTGPAVANAGPFRGTAADRGDGG